jgi:hypothetical protein
MRKVTTRCVPLVVGVSALALVATTPPALTKQVTVAGYARAKAEANQPAHFSYAKHWKRSHRAARVSRRPTGPARRSYETDLLLDCLLSQPFVICP